MKAIWNYSFIRPKSTEDVTLIKPYGILIPLYIYPADIYTNDVYNEIISLARSYPKIDVIAVLNPASGPGDVVDGNYLAAVKRLSGADVKVAGYVHSSYATRDINEIYNDILGWKNLYPGTIGIFIDEMTNDDNKDHVNYYAAITKFAKNVGFKFTVGNPGTLLPKIYFDNNSTDIIVTWESNQQGTESDYANDYAGGLIEVSRTRRSLILYNQSTQTSETLSVSSTTYSGTLSNYPVVQNSISLTYTINSTNYTATDDGNGNISGSDGTTGTIDYSTGNISITFSAQPDSGTDVTITYNYADYSALQDHMQMASKYHKYLFVTHDGYNNTNPYDNLSFYLESLFSHLSSL